MPLLSEKHRFDKRLSDRLVQNGTLKASDLESHLKNLPDDSANAERVVIDLEEAEIGNGSDGSTSNLE